MGAEAGLLSTKEGPSKAGTGGKYRTTRAGPREVATAGQGAGGSGQSLM